MRGFEKDTIDEIGDGIELRIVGSAVEGTEVFPQVVEPEVVSGQLDVLGARLGVQTLPEGQLSVRHQPEQRRLGVQLERPYVLVELKQKKPRLKF